MTASQPDLVRARFWFALLLLLWGSLVALAATTGGTQAIPTPLVPGPLVVLLLLPVVFYARSPGLRALVAAEDLRWLTLFHVWRLPAGLAFLWYGVQGELPWVFAALAGWGDAAAGVLALVVVALRPRRTRDGARRGYVAFHLFGLLDFVVAVGTGFTFSLLGHPLMGAVQALPLVLIVFVGVPVTGALGLVTLHRLVQATEDETRPAAVSSS
jgi:hypothetical protein